MRMPIEAVVLTGGASRRMGRDKASLLFEGVPLALRVIQKLTPVVSKVTVLGREEVPGYPFLADSEEYAGPLSALTRFKPSRKLVFVCSCDMPRFDSAIVELCLTNIRLASVCVPVVDGSRQPLCALYRASSFAAMKACGSRSMMGFLETVATVELSAKALSAAGVSAASVRGANTPEELAELSKKAFE